MVLGWDQNDGFEAAAVAEEVCVENVMACVPRAAMDRQVQWQPLLG